MDRGSDAIRRCSIGHEYPEALGECFECLATNDACLATVASTLANTTATIMLDARLAGRDLESAAAMDRAVELFREALSRLSPSRAAMTSMRATSVFTSAPEVPIDLSEIVRRDPAALTGRVLGGAYRIEAMLGSGGMGIVYRATRTATGAGVAIKVLRGLTGRDTIWKRMLQEARATRQIAHPGFTRIEDIVESDGIRYLVLELVTGQTLRKLLVDHGRLSVRSAVRIAGDVGEVLAAAHAVGLLHGGLKPEDIMLEGTASGTPEAELAASGRVRVLDLGLTVLERLGVDGGGSEGVVSSPLYRAPEQLKQSKLDGRTDVYALGMILYECLTGQIAFLEPDDASLTAVAARKVTGEAEPVSDFVDVPADLAALVSSSIARERDRRPRTMDDFLKKIRAIEKRG